MAPAASKVYDETVVVAILMALKAKGGTLADPYKDMVLLDGSRTNSSFEHSLRNLNKLAGTLNDKKAKGQTLTPADMGNNTTGDAPNTPAKAMPKKRGGKFHKHSELLHIVAEKTNHAMCTAASNTTGTSTPKRTRKSPAKSKNVSNDEDDDEELRLEDSGGTLYFSIPSPSPDIR